MIVGEERFVVHAGATVIVPDGATRGIEAETQLAFLAVRLPQSAHGIHRIPPITASVFINDDERGLHQALSWAERTETMLTRI
jgi:hypothetical protein